jgi:hypothetical protein
MRKDGGCFGGLNSFDEKIFEEKKMCLKKKRVGNEK